MKTFRIGLTGLLLALPLSHAVWAQATGPEIKADSKSESKEIRDGAANMNKPGATGMTHVPGNNSTMQGNQQSTAMKQTGGGDK